MNILNGLVAVATELIPPIATVEATTEVATHEEAGGGSSGYPDDSLGAAVQTSF